MPRPRRHTTSDSDGRPLKITFGEMREMGLRGVLVRSERGLLAGRDAAVRSRAAFRLLGLRQPRRRCQAGFERVNPQMAVMGYRNTT